MLINSLAIVLQIYLQFHCEHSGVIGLNQILHRQLPCTQARRLSLDENLRATEGGSEKTGETSSHSPLLFVTSHSRFALASVQCEKRSARGRGCSGRYSTKIGSKTTTKTQNKTKKSPVLNLNVTKLGERALVNGKNERFEQNPIWTLKFHFQFSFCSHFSFSRSSYSFRLPFSVLVTSVKFYLVFLVDIGGYCSLQSEELEEGNCQSLVNGTSGPYYAMECHVPYYYYYYKRDSKIRKCLSKWCSLIALCFNETSDWRKLCYKKFNWFRWSNFDISTATKDVNVSNVTNIYIKNCGWKRSLPRFKIKATGYRCASKTAQRGTYAEIKHC